MLAVSTRAHSPRAADQISMDVGFKNVRDRNLLLAGELKVAVHVGPWIKHGSDAFGIIADPMGKCVDAVGLDSFKNQGHRVLRISSRLGMTPLEECQRDVD